MASFATLALAPLQGPTLVVTCCLCENHRRTKQVDQPKQMLGSKMKANMLRAKRTTKTDKDRDPLPLK